MNVVYNTNYVDAVGLHVHLEEIYDIYDMYEFTTYDIYEIIPS